MPTVELDIRQLADEGGTAPLAPITVTDAVLDEDGNTLTDILDDLNAGLSQQQTGEGVGVTVLATSYFSTSKITLYRFGTLIAGSIILQCTANVSASIDVAQFNNITLPDYYFGVAAVSASQWTYDVTKMTRVYFKSNGVIGLNTSLTSGQFITIPVCLKAN